MPVCFRITEDHIKLIKEMKFEYSVLKGVSLKERSPIGGVDVWAEAEGILHHEKSSEVVKELHVAMNILAQNCGIEEGMYELKETGKWVKYD